MHVVEFKQESQSDIKEQLVHEVPFQNRPFPQSDLHYPFVKVKLVKQEVHFVESHVLHSVLHFLH